MRLRWSAAAANDLANITEYLFEKTPQHAARMVRSLYDAVSSLKTYPNRGRQGKKAGTRELAVRSSPYVVVYQVSGEIVYVARILHGAQKWPE
jgi:toxin ParE1/3/4